MCVSVCVSVCVCVCVCVSVCDFLPSFLFFLAHKESSLLASEGPLSQREKSPSSYPFFLLNPLLLPAGVYYQNLRHSATEWQEINAY